MTHENAPQAPTGSIAYVGPGGTPPIDLGAVRFVEWVSEVLHQRRMDRELRAMCCRPVVECC